MSNFLKFIIYPKYRTGFSFAWELVHTCAKPMPWKFVIQKSEDRGTTWEDFSSIVTNLFLYESTTKTIGNLEPNLEFRVKFTAADNSIEYSFTKHPYGDLNKREFLLFKEIFRKELLLMTKSSGTVCDLWKMSPYKELPSDTLDPITGDIINPDKAFPAMYVGPYKLYAAFNPLPRKKDMDERGDGLAEKNETQAKVLGYPFINNEDVLVDIDRDKRYYVSDITNVAEMRRIPIIQQMVLNEVPVTEPIYKLGSTI